MSVGAEHWAGGIRAAKFGCRTDQVTIADTEGKISVSALSKDKEFKSLLEDGWDLKVFPAECEEVWPTFPDLANKRLMLATALLLTNRSLM